MFPQVSLKQARDERDYARQQVSQGIDPVQARRERQQSQREKLDNSFQALAPIRQKHFAAQTTPDELAPVLNAIDGYRGAPETVIALELLPILLLRPGNIRALEWSQVDIKARRIELAITKNGDPLVVPLSDQALSALQRIEPLSRHRSRFVFPGARSAARPMSDNAMGAALRNLGMKDQQTAHGFRAVARTMLVERLGFAVELVEMQLGHRVADASATLPRRPARSIRTVSTHLGAPGRVDPARAPGGGVRTD